MFVIDYHEDYATHGTMSLVFTTREKAQSYIDQMLEGMRRKAGGNPQNDEYDESSYSVREVELDREYRMFEPQPLSGWDFGENFIVTIRHDGENEYGFQTLEDALAAKAFLEQPKKSRGYGGRAYTSITYYNVYDAEGNPLA